MASVYIFSLVICLALVNIQGESLQIGTSLNSELIHIELVKLSAIPLKVRTKNVFYNNGTNAKIIKGINVIDLDKSEAKAIITAGGVGSTFANIKLKSSRGDGLNYQIQIYG